MKNSFSFFLCFWMKANFMLIEHFLCCSYIYFLLNFPKMDWSSWLTEGKQLRWPGVVHKPFACRSTTATPVEYSLHATFPPSLQLPASSFPFTTNANMKCKYRSCVFSCNCKLIVHTFEHIMYIMNENGKIKYEK